MAHSIKPTPLSLELKALCDLVTAHLSSLISHLLLPVDYLFHSLVRTRYAEHASSCPSALARKSPVSPLSLNKMPPPSVWGCDLPSCVSTITAFT